MAEILPIESADYHYIAQGEKSYLYPYSLSSDAIKNYDEEIKYIPCWSLSALLGVLPDDCCGIDKEDGKYAASYVVSNEGGTYISDNPVDACVAMVEKLNELKLLRLWK